MCCGPGYRGTKPGPEPIIGPMSDRRCVVGVDLGGTNVRAQALDSAGRPVGERFEGPSHAQSGQEATLASVAAVIRQAWDDAETTPEAIGLAIPGHIDDEAGLVRWAPNFGIDVDGVFRYWEDVPVRPALQAVFPVPVVMANDANAAALGEYHYGSGKGSANCLVLLTLGTGIGGGVVMAPAALHGQVSGPVVLLGGNKGGAELGHICLLHGGLDCNAGSYGALEAYCQRDAIVRRATHRLARGVPSIMNDMVGGNLANLTPKMMADSADQGDRLAQSVWREIGEMLGVGVGSFINVFAPDIVAIGGQVAKAGDWLLEPVRETARNIAIPSLFAAGKIVAAEQLEDAGILGGAALAHERIA